MAEHPAALAQVETTNVASLVQALGMVLDAAAFSSRDQNRLIAFVQPQQGEQVEDTGLSAPDAAIYKSYSGSIVDVLEDMKERAKLSSYLAQGRGQCAAQ